MSSADKLAHDDVCASCGIKGGNYIKLKTCTACKLVKYCSVECQRKHRSHHKRACKKRAAELRDELLFQQPDCTHLGECPICCVPIPFEIDDDGGLISAGYHVCCSKRICIGCIHESGVQELEQNCPFCRTPYPETEAKAKKMFDKQVKRGNHDAIRTQADRCVEQGNYSEAFKYYMQAAKGGEIEAHLQLGRMYSLGQGVEKDNKRAIFRIEEAAIGGHPKARITLSEIEIKYGKKERAVKHWIIGAKLGSKEVLEQLKQGYKDGIVSKEAFEEGLRGYREAVNAMKTPQREAAKQNSDLVDARVFI